MPTIVLRDSEGSDVGFALVGGSEPLQAGPSQRDIVLMKLPLPSASPLAEFIGNHKNTEFFALVQVSPAGISVRFEVVPALPVTFEFTSSGTGTWSAGSLGSGICQILAK